MTKQRMGGYGWRRELNRARLGVCRARVAMTRMVDTTEMGGQMRSGLLASAALALGEAMEALGELERIGGEVNSEHESE